VEARLTPAHRSAPHWRAGIIDLRDNRASEQTSPFDQAQRASVGSTEASASLPVRVGVVGSTDARKR
jgi:hypothetical protein